MEVIVHGPDLGNPAHESSCSCSQKIIGYLSGKKQDVIKGCHVDVGFFPEIFILLQTADGLEFYDLIVEHRPRAASIVGNTRSCSCAGAGGNNYASLQGR